MKKALSILLLCLLLYGCINLYNESNALSLLPPEFSSEKEFVEGVKYARKSKIKLLINFMNRDIETPFKIDRITEYYMPINIPSGYEMDAIYASYNNVWSCYKKYGEEYKWEKAYTFGCYFRWSIEKTIEHSELVASKHNDKLYFDYDNYKQRYSRVYYELDGNVAYIVFPEDVAIDIESKQDIKMIENLCTIRRETIPITPDDYSRNVRIDYQTLILTFVLSIIVLTIISIMKKNGVKVFLLRALFVAYIHVLICAMVLPLVLYFYTKEQICFRYNIIPFIDDIKHYVIYPNGEFIFRLVWKYVKYILFFIPMGFLLPLVSKKITEFRKIVSRGAIVSILIALFHLLMSCLMPYYFYKLDINTVILNSIGVMIGFAIYTILNKKVRVDTRT